MSMSMTTFMTMSQKSNANADTNRLVLVALSGVKNVTDQRKVGQGVSRGRWPAACITTNLTLYNINLVNSLLTHQPASRVESIGVLLVLQWFVSVCNYTQTFHKLYVPCFWVSSVEIIKSSWTFCPPPLLCVCIFEQRVGGTNICWHIYFTLVHFPQRLWKPDDKNSAGEDRDDAVRADRDSADVPLHGQHRGHPRVLFQIPLL